ncbi:MAG: hypothetical protein NZ927_05445 [Candidatus Calescibacterium sp.]|nr:hypothetical protein [Candidatus Calescibacterium sp.]MCX7733187.1 hypothetical protein [bacterium]MDW8086895.1 hypothetical protein [Candidatus Calescibacterium sp.]
MKYSVIKKFSGKNLLKIFEKVKEDTNGNAVLLGYEEKLVGGEKFYEVIVGIPDTKNKIEKIEKSKDTDFSEKITEIREILEKIEELKREFLYVRENIEFISKKTMNPAEIRLPQEALNFFKKLVSRGIERSIALSITEDIMNSRLNFDLKGLSSVVSKYMIFRNPLADGRKKFISLVGPTGVGKTTTAAKISALYAISKSKNVALLETDRYRIASVDQMKKYAEIMGVPLFVATNPEEIRTMLPKLMKFDLVVVDTMGKSQYDIKNIKRISSVLSEIGNQTKLEIALLISTSQKDEEIVLVIKGFSEIGIDYFIFTKVDETSYPGTILNIGCTTETPIAFITTGQSVPDDIKIASPDVISDVILGPPPLTMYLLKT